MWDTCTDGALRTKPMACDQLGTGEQCTPEVQQHVARDASRGTRDFSLAQNMLRSIISAGVRS